jgi:hypothetical protein
MQRSAFETLVKWKIFQESPLYLLAKSFKKGYYKKVENVKILKKGESYVV